MELRKDVICVELDGNDEEAIERVQEMLKTLTNEMAHDDKFVLIDDFEMQNILYEFIDQVREFDQVLNEKMSRPRN